MVTAVTSKKAANQSTKGVEGRRKRRDQKQSIFIKKQSKMSLKLFSESTQH